MHLKVNHLSRLLTEIGDSPVDDMLVYENLFVITAKLDWYANIVEFPTTLEGEAYECYRDHAECHFRGLRLNIKKFFK